ncbi:metallophosphoesterase family protein [Desulfobulbus elongatus]|uniref:metallophosphoesterase family protein n=1 Tax=Desulfobulbus elongatus TaxID=53332 RepID=UPI00054ED9F0|nr:metallophosphoesterase [Desulfobulbus elongatus]
MMQLDRRKFLRIGGASLAGLAVSGLDLPWLSYKPALATAISEDAWCFGIMADTQWRTGSNAGGEPASCAVAVIDALNQQFIGHQCAFVIQVGDLVDTEAVNGVRSLPTRAEHCQALYDAGIGFFPVRGNHEASATAANELPVLFPQTTGTGAHVFGATNFTSPMEKLQGLSYSFDWENVRCVLVDQFTRKDNTSYNNSTNNNVVDQVDWVDQRLADTGDDRHAFVFAHKNLIGQNHKDVLFGGNLASNAEARDAFLRSLDTNGVRYYFGGHDHMHHRSIVTDSTKQYAVDQIICSSNSYKFYIPKSGDDGRETPVCQELFTLGYYIVTVDGPRVTVDFYSSSHGHDYGDFDLVNPPSSFNFYLRERFGYSLNGNQYLVNRGEAYTSIQGQYQGTSARILSGVNGNSETDYLERRLAKTVNTGWAGSDAVADAASCIFSLWGMVDNLSLYNASLTGLLPAAKESTATDVYTLSLSYDPAKVRPSQLVTGKFALALRDDTKVWHNAVDLNAGGTKKFVYGPWKQGYGLGTYGVDPKTATVWAVIDQEGDFVAKFI